MSDKKFKLIKISRVEYNFMSGKKLYYPCIKKENYPYIYSQFEKILDDINILAYEDLRDARVYEGSYITELRNGDNFEVFDGTDNMYYASTIVTTTTVEKIFTKNMFLTKNSLYFLHDKAYERNEKLNDLLNT